MVSNPYPKTSAPEDTRPLKSPSVSLTRDADTVLAQHRQLYVHSVATSLIELMLKLMGSQAPDLQSREAELQDGWRSLVDQPLGGVVLRRLEWDRELFRHLLAGELGRGRPVGLLLNERAAAGQPAGERAWAVIRLNEVRPYLFLDLVGKNPELGGGEGQFTAKRMIRLDELSDRDVAAVFYCAS